MNGPRRIVSFIVILLSLVGSAYGAEDFDSLMAQTEKVSDNYDRLELLIRAEKAWVDAGWSLESREYMDCMTRLLFYMSTRYETDRAGSYLPKAERLLTSPLRFQERSLLAYVILLNFSQRGAYERALELSRSMYEACRSVKPFSLQATMHVLFGIRLGSSLIDAGSYNQAVAILLGMRDLAADIPPEETVFTANKAEPAQYLVEISLELARAYMEAGDFQTALLHLRDAEMADANVSMDNAPELQKYSGGIGTLFGMRIAAAKAAAFASTGEEEQLAALVTRMDQFTATTRNLWDWIGNLRFLFQFGESKARMGDFQAAAEAIARIDSYSNRPAQGGLPDLLLDGKIRMLRERVGLAQGGAQGAALEGFSMARASFARIGYLSGVHEASMEIAKIQIAQGKHRDAMLLLESSIGGIEEILAGTEGRLKRDYLALQSDAYVFLAKARVLSGDPKGGLLAFEASRARYLYEQVLGTWNPAEQAATLERALSGIEAGTTVLEYGIAGGDLLVWRIGGGPLKAFVVSLSAITADFLKTGVVSRAAMDRLRSERLGFLKRGVQVRAVPPGAALDDFTFDDCLSFYRSLLSQPGDGTFLPAAGVLYGHLVAPFLAGPDQVPQRLVVIPDGEMAAVPFETFWDGRGFLAQRCVLSEAPSLAVRRALADRGHSTDRRPLMAFGDAEYAGGERGQADTAAGNNFQLDRMYDDFLEDPDPRLIPAFLAGQGIGGFLPLPGTRTEVSAIVSAFPGAASALGKEATREGLLAIERGRTRYRYLHIAVHGIAFPRHPEMSSLILSPDAGTPAAQSYLTAREASDLHLDADLVTLSACETGLGRIYKGEGMVGLAYGFLAGGADSCLVSLWSVSDEATAEFMRIFYAKLGGTPGGEAKALAETKREFLSGRAGTGIWTDPFYWSAFVLQGK